MRDSPGFGLYFCLYELFKRKLGVDKTLNNGHNTFETVYKTFLAGGVAGSITWFTVYPMDTVKAKL
jgi:solute carrier family 25 carnitine/acylcarnitine transporter 20/29